MSLNSTFRVVPVSIYWDDLRAIYLLFAVVVPPASPPTPKAAHAHPHPSALDWLVRVPQYTHWLPKPASPTHKSMPHSHYLCAPRNTVTCSRPRLLALVLGPCCDTRACSRPHPFAPYSHSQPSATVLVAVALTSLALAAGTHRHTQFGPPELAAICPSQLPSPALAAAILPSQPPSCPRSRHPALAAAILPSQPPSCPRSRHPALAAAILPSQPPSCPRSRHPALAAAILPLQPPSCPRSRHPALAAAPYPPAVTNTRRSHRPHLLGLPPTSPALTAIHALRCPRSWPPLIERPRCSFCMHRLHPSAPQLPASIRGCPSTQACSRSQ
ncbi:hypothetical protein FIBSPDRAFT_956402 [Athelia psychrophila]|uniref:Uncharacterized protein n=1 Tax=Athelia psychrophila TaxID=1759441 RepID=A0A166GW15_9AGAM|nr:hypothetical protein FIBSPDRAFT_956402 [Fibularhizoctonia sp. CBS 109695]